MLKARLSNGTFVLGLDANNIRELQKNRPIVVSLSKIGGTDKVVIMFGETLAHIARELEEASGGPLPPVKLDPEPSS